VVCPLGGGKLVPLVFSLIGSDRCRFKGARSSGLLPLGRSFSRCQAALGRTPCRRLL